MTTPDPKRRQMKCPACGVLVPLDNRGRYFTHVLPPPPGTLAFDTHRDWCPQSGRQAVAAPAPKIGRRR